jgi:hypothetical protein
MKDNLLSPPAHTLYHISLDVPPGRPDLFGFFIVDTNPVGRYTWLGMLEMWGTPARAGEGGCNATYRR